ncbi:reticulon-like protein B12 isoform X2 [Ziziphus jujuba]|uniref:Reticulon-like protein n=1 Tax=Ziziphus jujuba TaxID=326968 RepID=A0ABM3I4U5_ZIZJJ|nr:reticulon-like protein B12 isoform X2 [Ziziphus jujuba]
MYVYEIYIKLSFIYIYIYIYLVCIYGKSKSKKSHEWDTAFRLQRRVHDILGAGLVADVILWRRKNVTVGILLVTLAAWVVFERSGYTLLSLVSSVFLLLIIILFLWAKSAAILNRPAPPLPELHLSEEMVNEVAAMIRTHVNNFLSVSQDIALGKDSRLFFKVAACLWLISFVGGLTDFLTLGYVGLVIILTIPALYERYEDYIDKYVIMGYRKLRQFCVLIDQKSLIRFQNLDLEKKKLS